MQNQTTGQSSRAYKALPRPAVEKPVDDTQPDTGKRHIYRAPLRSPQRRADTKKPVYKRPDAILPPPRQPVSHQENPLPIPPPTPPAGPPSPPAGTGGTPKPYRHTLPPTPLQRKTAQVAHTDASSIPTEPTGETVTAAPLPEPEPPKKRRGRFLKSLIGDLFFFVLLLAVVLGIGIYRQSQKSVFNIFGYSFFNVLTESMQSEIPRGSLVISKATPGEELQVGDDITFMRDANTVVTHRIVRVEENFENSGGRGFETKGLENNLPDENIVHEGNVMGKVVRHFPNVGFALTLIAANLKWLVVIIALVFLLIVTIRYLLSTREAKGNTKPPIESNTSSYRSAAAE